MMHDFRLTALRMANDVYRGSGASQQTVIATAREFLAFLENKTEPQPNAAPAPETDRDAEWAYPYALNEKAPEPAPPAPLEFGSFMWAVDLAARGRTVTRAAEGPQPRIFMKEGILQTRDNRPFLPIHADFMSKDWCLA